MLILNQNEPNFIYLTLNENLYSNEVEVANMCNYMLDYQFTFKSKNTLSEFNLVLSDTSLHPQRYNEFELPLLGVTASYFALNGTYEYEVYLYDGVGATGSVLENGMVKVIGSTATPVITTKNNTESIFVRNNK